MAIDLAALEVGAALPAQAFGPATRTVLALYAGGSGDHNPIHIDLDFAHAAGQPDVFAHGMLSMAYMAQYIAAIAPAGKLRSWSVRFTAMTPANASVICSGRISGRNERRREVTLAVTAGLDDGRETIVGEAMIVL